jgi:outer membrane protein TolC
MALGAFLLTAPCVFAQVSLTTAVDLALRNSPKVKMAEADLDKARASLAEAHDAYIPAITSGGGIGASAGVPLSLPVIFNFSAQSLAFNFSQPDYVRAARAGMAAATLALNEARSEAAEDVARTYVTLDSALRRRDALTQANSFATQLVKIAQDRFDAGVDPKIEVTRSQRTAVQMRLQKKLVEDEISTLSDHLARLTGVRTPELATVHSSIPDFSATDIANQNGPDSDSIKAAFANATAKSYVAHGDQRYRWLPQIAFSAGYSRISTIGTNYILYYPGFDPARHPDISYNSLDVGVQISIPLLDLVHQAKARGSAAEAARAHFEAEDHKMEFYEGRLKLKNAASELADRAELASLDRDLAQDQLDTIELQLKADSATSESQQMTPRDEQNARLQERQRYIEFLDADLQLRQTEISLMRQNGELGDWLHAAITQPPATTAAPTAPSLPVSRP